MSNSEIDRKQRQAVGRKLATVLAGGLVLAFGAGVTVASWHDSEATTANFSAGRSNPGPVVNPQGFNGYAIVAGLTAP